MRRSSGDRPLSAALAASTLLPNVSRIILAAFSVGSLTKSGTTPPTRFNTDAMTGRPPPNAAPVVTSWSVNAAPAPPAIAPPATRSARRPARAPLVIAAVCAAVRPAPMPPVCIAVPTRCTTPPARGATRAKAPPTPRNAAPPKPPAASAGASSPAISPPAK